MSEEEQQLNRLAAGRPKPRQLTLAEIPENPAQAIGSTPGSLPAFIRPWKRATLKIFLGAAAGVGKTYAMLEEAQQLKTEGLDVVIGYVELHGRQETERLLAGLEVVPRRVVEYREMRQEELDTAAVIARHPQLVLIDELAHTNPPGSPFEKRYQDIEEILKHDIDVYSTVNVQHLESLNDQVYELTGTRVRETFPDRIFDLADEVVLIDLAPDDLRRRIREGKVYRPEKIDLALENFFKTSNLLALRALALRETADAIQTSGSHHQYKALHEEEPPTGQPFVLICVSLKPQDARLIRRGWRFARRLNAPAEVVNISRDDEHLIKDEKALVPLRRLALALNLPFHELKGDPVEQISQLARAKQATLLVLGESTRKTWRERLFGSFTDKLVNALGKIDINIVADIRREEI
jgi:two-component system sensor histidine kinase KdpD